MTMPMLMPMTPTPMMMDKAVLYKALWLINQMSQKLCWKIEKNDTGKVREICLPLTVKPFKYGTIILIKKNFKKYWKTEKNTGKVRGICQSEKVGTMDLLLLLMLNY